MPFFSNLRPLVQCVTELRRIADALCYFAESDARANGRMFRPISKPPFWATDKSEFIPHDPATIRQTREVEAELFIQRGYPALEELDSKDDLD